MKKPERNIKLEILQYNHYEHFKAGKDLAFVLPIEHPKRQRIEQATNDLIEEINKIKKEK